MSDLPYERWVEAVDRLMKRDWCIDTADAGLDDAELFRYWRAGEYPAVFVAWFAEKYDLIRYESTGSLADDRP